MSEVRYDLTLGVDIQLRNSPATDLDSIVQQSLRDSLTSLLEQHGMFKRVARRGSSSDVQLLVQLDYAHKAIDELYLMPLSVLTLFVYTPSRVESVGRSSVMLRAPRLGYTRMDSWSERSVGRTPTGIGGHGDAMEESVRVLSKKILSQVQQFVWANADYFDQVLLAKGVALTVGRKETLSTGRDPAMQATDAQMQTGVTHLTNRGREGTAARPPVAAQELPDRIALVIGNGAYRNAPPLENPKGDASAIAAELNRLGFRVTVYSDLGTDAMRRALREFRKRLQNSDLSLFYFAGHAVQVDGLNYLLPIDARIEQVADLAYDAVQLEAVMEEMEGSSAGRILILDACRDNPFVEKLASSLPRGRSVGLARGLAMTRRQSIGTLVAYATSPGQIAVDGSGNHSPYTAALVEWLPHPDLEIGEVFRRVREQVIRDTEGRQVPWENSSLVGGGIYLGRFP
ncbi:MAG: caspase family protein [Myxococcota bacterium]